MATAEAHVPPQNLEAEESVLGALMVSSGALDAVVLDVRLNEDDFYRERHRLVFRAIKRLYERSEAIDAITVSELLRSEGELEEAGGRDTVSHLASVVPVPGNAKHYAEIVKRNALLRRLLSASHTIQQSVNQREGEPRDLVERAEALLFQVAHDERSKDFSRLAEILEFEVDRLEALAKGDLEVTGTPSGFRDLDGVLGGFQPGNLITIAARPSVGKSALVCNIAENVATKYQLPVAFFSLEMSEAELAHRFIASRSRIPNDRLRKGKVAERDWPRVVRACNQLESAPLWIDESSDLSLLELRAKSRRLAASEGGKLGLVIVDYMQLMRAEDPRANRVEQVGQFSRGLKILARELDVPVIGLSQLSRAPEQRPDKRPMLSDLRESGCLTGDVRVLLPCEGRYASLAELEGKSGFQVLAVDPQTWKLEPRTVTHAFSTGRKPVYRLRTQLGREIRATANHRFLALDGWHRLDQLEPGVRIALPRRTAGPKRRSMSDDELALLGHLIGDGCTLPTHAIQYTTNEMRLAEVVSALATAVFGDRVRPRIAVEQDRKRNRQWLQVFLPPTQRLTHGRQNPVAAWLRELGVFGLRSHQKRVPGRVFEQDDAGIAVFLRHLWATDGCVHLSERGRPTPRIYYATSSPQLARDVQSLLLRLGITARRRVATPAASREHWHVVISGAPNQRAFLELVGGLGESRERHSHAILRWLDDSVANTNRDVIPREAWTLLVKPRLSETGVTSRAFQASLGTQYCGSTLYKAAMSRERASRVAEILDLDQLRHLADSDLYWDVIESIEPAGEEQVYDLTVEGLHSFVAEDIVVHNSIEQDSDVVTFIYRDALYNDEADPSEAELIVAKHRNGPIGKVDVVFLEQYPRFVDRARGGERPIEQKAGEGGPLVDLADEA